MRDWKYALKYFSPEVLAIAKVWPILLDLGVYMAIKPTDIKLLWARCAGHCANPDCKAELTGKLEKHDLPLGEMAHIIARAPDGPRGNGEGGNNSYENLVLLCPSCHNLVDKAPDGFPADMLLEWKKQTEEAVERIGSERKFGTAAELCRDVSNLLRENRLIWENYGPESKVAKSNPGSNAYDVWDARKSSELIPRNREIVKLVDRHTALLSTQQLEAFAAFKEHVDGFERNHLERQDKYPTFPAAFEREFACE